MTVSVVFLIVVWRLLDRFLLRTTVPSPPPSILASLLRSSPSWSFSAITSPVWAFIVNPRETRRLRLGLDVDAGVEVEAPSVVAIGLKVTF